MSAAGAGTKAAGVVERVEAEVRDFVHVELSLEDLRRSRKLRERFFELLYDLGWSWRADRKVEAEVIRSVELWASGFRCVAIRYSHGHNGERGIAEWQVFKLPTREGTKVYVVRRVLEDEPPFDALDDRVEILLFEDEEVVKAVRRVAELVVDEVEEVRRLAGASGPLDASTALGALAYVLAESGLYDELVVRT
jgi:hypothetical protein